MSLSFYSSVHPKNRGGLSSKEAPIDLYFNHLIIYWSERWLAPKLRGGRLHELVVFGIKQARAASFGGSLLVLILLTSLFDFNSIARYDFLFLGAIFIQVMLLILKIETWKETQVILLFHIVATLMELFKTHPSIGSWQYPEPCFFKIGNLPLFTGFMYSAVGSFIARSWKIMRLRYTKYPSFKVTMFLAITIYLNFFTHHFIYDFRYLLFGLIGLFYFRTEVYFVVYQKERKMPMLLAFILISFFLWLAENAGTYGNMWQYPNQEEVWQMVSLGKMGAWFLLMIVSFVLVSTHQRHTLFSDR
jgi:uncharacterized membrane protein YoaT (DUF817 family)